MGDGSIPPTKPAVTLRPVAVAVKLSGKVARLAMRSVAQRLQGLPHAGRRVVPLADYDGTQRMHPELKSCNDAKIPTAAANAPEEFRLRCCACPNDVASRGHDLRTQQAVDGKGRISCWPIPCRHPGLNLPHLYAKSRLPVPRSLQELSRDRDRQGVPRRRPRSCAYSIDGDGS